MSLLLVFVFIGLTLFLVAQFGGKLTARNSLVWWGIFSFLLFCLVSPGSLTPIAHALGIQLVSNFVLAAMILFLIAQAIQESAFSTAHARKLRDIVSSQAADAFAEKYKQEILSLRPKVVICMPCYNESEHLPVLTTELKNFEAKYQASHYEFVFCIVNDGSTDGCRSLLDQKLFHASTSHLSNIGVAGALLTSFKVAQHLDAAYVVQCDADGQHPLEMIPMLIDQASLLGSDLLIGSRYVSKIGDASSTQVRRFGSQIITLTLKLFSFKTEVKDPTSGFRVYSKSARKLLLSTMPDDYPEPETIAILFNAKLKVQETPVKMDTRQGGVSSLSGIAGGRFMIKVISALLGFRLRTLFS